MAGSDTVRPEEASRPGLLMAIGDIVHRSPRGKPTTVPLRWGQPLETDEEVWSRTFTARGEWAPLEAGWFAGKPSGHMTLENQAGADRTVYPTPEEAAAESSLVVEIGLAPPDPPAEKNRDMHSPPKPPPPAVQPFARVRPGKTMPGFEPADLSRLRVRCEAGPCRCVLTIFPA